MKRKVVRSLWYTNKSEIKIAPQKPGKNFRFSPVGLFGKAYKPNYSRIRFLCVNYNQDVSIMLTLARAKVVVTVAIGRQNLSFNIPLLQKEEEHEDEKSERVDEMVNKILESEPVRRMSSEF